MSCRKAGPDSSGILSLSNSCLRPPGQVQGEGRLGSELAHLAVPFLLPQLQPFLCWAFQRQSLTGPAITLCAKDEGAPFYRGHRGSGERYSCL